MSKQTCAGNKQSNTRIKEAELQNKDILELIRELDEKMENIDEFSFDADLVEEYLDQMQVQVPVMTHGNAEQSLADFREKHALLFSESDTKPVMVRKKKTENKKRWLGAIAACLVIFLGATAMVGSAMGVNLFQTFYIWGEGVLHIRNQEPSGNMVLSNSNDQFDSLAEAMESEGISGDFCPKWIPEDFSISFAEVQKAGSLTVITAVYESADKTIIITVNKSDDPANLASVVEKDEGGQIYKKNGVEYFLLTNEGIPTAVWVADYHVFNIFGGITEKELKQIIDSI